ncbi:MAG: hypothetical protein NTW87_22350 [Planctomycetota bacterium]|nr:hypothetical protein [Planctomycetota bacterium]
MKRETLKATACRTAAYALAISAAAVLAAAVQAEDKEPIKHRFLMYDEGRGILHYVDERDAAKDWKLQLPKDDLETKKLVQDVKVPGVGGVFSARRRADGFTVLGANAAGVQVLELDKDNKLVRKMKVPGASNLRMIRLTSDGGVVCAEQKGMIEVAFDDKAPNGCKVVKTIPLPRAQNAFMALKKDDGSYLLSGGYAHAVFDFGPDGALRKEYMVKDPPKGVDLHFFAGIQVLKNGNIVACNWTGHEPQDSAKGWQLLEFSPDGALVWHWHNPAQAGTAINIAILDDLDENAFLDDSSGVLKAVPAK